jgi:hypothetical protein
MSNTVSGKVLPSFRINKGFPEHGGSFEIIQGTTERKKGYRQKSSMYAPFVGDATSTRVITRQQKVTL